MAMLRRMCSRVSSSMRTLRARAHGIPRGESKRRILVVRLVSAGQTCSDSLCLLVRHRGRCPAAGHTGTASGERRAAVAVEGGARARWRMRGLLLAASHVVLDDRAAHG